MLPPRPVPLGLFFVILFGVCWLGTLPVILSSWRGPSSVPAALRPLQLLILFGPGLVAVGVTAVEGGRSAVARLLIPLLRWRVGIRWYLVAVVGPALLMLAALGASRLLDSATVPSPTPQDILSRFISVFGVYLVLNTEEMAWRGYVLPRLQLRMSPLRASLQLGVVWAVFHAPLFLMRGGHPAGYPPLLFGALIVGLSVLFTAVFNHTGGSLLLVHLLHQSFNAWGEAIPLFPAAVHSLMPIGLVTAGVCAVGLIAARWPRLMSPVRSSGARR